MIQTLWNYSLTCHSFSKFCQTKHLNVHTSCWTKQFAIICNGCSMLTEDAYSSGHLVPSHLGLAYDLLVETNPFPKLVFLVHLSRRLKCTIVITRRPSVCPSLFFHIFDFSSKTAKQNSTKLDRKQDLNVLYQVCVFQADRKNKMAALASDWLRHFRLLLWNRWIEFNETCQEARS